MPQTEENISINVTVDIPVSTLKMIVENSKKIAGTDEKGIYRVDTAEKVNQMVSTFLNKYAFDEYVKDISNYKS